MQHQSSFVEFLSFCFATYSVLPHDLPFSAKISFTIVRNGKGEPQARNVMRAEEAMALKAKIQKRERREQEQKRQKHQVLATQSLQSEKERDRGGAARCSRKLRLEKVVVSERATVMSEEEAKRFQEALKKKRL
ncbi:unnamed protein product [Durusdinium trenchii]|uniref:Uncharacterized protein n=1 Tax=Durusdinium trenchii TaxID=1381693 RepID=A0ABP0MBP7_9DINO